MSKAVEKMPPFRKKRKFKSPNPLFVEWLTEWRDGAASKGLNSRFNFAKALSSLKKYPLPLSSGKEAKILEYFGDKICKMLDERLEQHKVKSLNSETAAMPTASLHSSGSSSIKKSKTKERIKSSVSKKRTKQNPSTLIHSSSQESIVPISSLQHSFPLAQIPIAIPTAGISEDYMAENETSSALNCDNSFTLQPGQFDIFLCVDNCETLSGQSKSRKKFLEELKVNGMDFLIRKLNVGDFLWIAKEKSSYNDSATSNTRELVLDFVIERKRLDDLAKSIKDGRFREQKFRLKSCGLRRPTYLVENLKLAYMGLPESTLEQAIINTQIIDGFMVKKTKDIKESVAYLSAMTKYIQNSFQQRILKSASREEIEKFFIIQFVPYFYRF